MPRCFANISSARTLACSLTWIAPLAERVTPAIARRASRGQESAAAMVIGV